MRKGFTSGRHDRASGNRKGAGGWTPAFAGVTGWETFYEAILFELTSREEVPTAVVIDEAVELAKRFSTDDSGKFVNGVLAAVAKKVRPAGV